MLDGEDHPDSGGLVPLRRLSHFGEVIEVFVPSVVQAYANPDYTIVVHFDDGKVVRRDIKHLLDKGGVFEALKDKDFFLKRLTVLHGTVAWSTDFDEQNCLDLVVFLLANVM